MAEQNEKHDKTVGLNIKLMPVDHSDQPVLANFTRLNGAPGMVFVDFGFLEPAALSALSRLARSGGKIPEPLRLQPHVVPEDDRVGAHKILSENFTVACANSSIKITSI